MTVHSPSASQSRIFHVGENYLSQESEYEVFGLGDDATIDSVTVLWPSGLMETFDATVHNLVSGGFYVLEEGSSLCNDTHQIQNVCGFPSDVQSHEETGFFEVTWTQAGETWEGIDGPPAWNAIDDGPWTMSLSWQDIPLCETTIGVAFSPLHGDLDLNGHVGVSDLFLVLEELGCMGACAADLDNDHTVGIVDLMSFLAAFGNACGQ